MSGESRYGCGCWNLSDCINRKCFLLDLCIADDEEAPAAVKETTDT